MACITHETVYNVMAAFKEISEWYESSAGADKLKHLIAAAYKCMEDRYRAIIMISVGRQFIDSVRKSLDDIKHNERAYSNWRLQYALEKLDYCFLMDLSSWFEVNRDGVIHKCTFIEDEDASCVGTINGGDPKKYWNFSDWMSEHGFSDEDLTAHWHCADYSRLCYCKSWACYGDCGQLICGCIDQCRCRY